MTGTDRSPSLIAVDISSQFQPEENSAEAIMRNMSAAFLIALSGEGHPLYEKAIPYLNRPWQEVRVLDSARFFRNGLALVPEEIEKKAAEDHEFGDAVERLHEWCMRPAPETDGKQKTEKIWSVFFPEGVSADAEGEEAVALLREKRTVTITRPNSAPITDPAREILFTSNILLTIPHQANTIDDLPLSPDLRVKLKAVAQEDQQYWYDHPIPIGVALDKNEVIYGLRGLNDAVAFEKERGTIPEQATITCVLSVSVTHRGLQHIAKDYLEEELKKAGGFEHLKVYLFTEASTTRLIGEILAPAAARFLGTGDSTGLHDVFGVDGEYGRHYSFLKAIAAFWQVFIDPGIRGTFKIDLDQVFPQPELVEQTGSSAFEHFKTPLWGAAGIDHWGKAVDLGMIAGALVNESDIADSLFRPDVRFPANPPRGDEYIFFSALPQAVSTEAEMMTRYRDGSLDGSHQCIQRVHVTGGTNGILVDRLRKYRPFTPTFIGRAEDQAYLLSVLFSGSTRNLRYVHKDGLIMRHDKEAFAAEAMEAAYTGKLIGDYARILLFSAYANALPWPLKDIKEQIDPFTGCFASPIPRTVVYLRFALKAAFFFQKGDEKSVNRGVEFVSKGAKRLGEIMQWLQQEPKPLIARHEKEKRAWDIYYDVLDQVEGDLRKGETTARQLQKKAATILGECKINFS